MSPIWSAAGEEQSPYLCCGCLENSRSLVPQRTFTTYASGSRAEICQGPWCDSTPSGVQRPHGRSRIGLRSKLGTAWRLGGKVRQNEFTAIPEGRLARTRFFIVSLCGSWLANHISNFIAFPHTVTGSMRPRLGAECPIKARGLQG